MHTLVDVVGGGKFGSAKKRKQKIKKEQRWKTKFPCVGHQVPPCWPSEVCGENWESLQAGCLLGRP